MDLPVFRFPKKVRNSAQIMPLFYRIQQDSHWCVCVISLHYQIDEGILYQLIRIVGRSDATEYYLDIWPEPLPMVIPDTPELILAWFII